jgi:hypothetical protein
MQISHNIPHNKLAEKISQKNPEYEFILIYNKAAMDNWLLLLLIEISSIVHCCFIINQNELIF